MRKITVLALFIVAMVFPLSLVGADGVAPDVDGDGTVSIQDIGWTVSWFGSTNPPKSGGTVGAADTYGVGGTEPEFSPELGWVSLAPCDPGDAVTGGGYVATDPPAPTRNDSFPVVFNEPGQELDHWWAVTATDSDFYAVANCLDNSPAHEVLTASGSATAGDDRITELTEHLRPDLAR